MLFHYKAVDQQGADTSGEIDAISRDLAVSALQQRGLVVVSVNDPDSSSILERSIPFLSKIPLKEIVIMSRQLATLFEAQVPAVKAFTLMSESSINKTLRNTLQGITQDIQGGITIADAMEKYPEAFSDFFVNMVRAGEESGRLSETFIFLSDYLERTQEIVSKTRNALVYPSFVVVTFIVVMILMLTLVIPQLSEILLETGQEIPFYTRVVIGTSDFFTGIGGIVVAILVLGGGAGLYMSSRTENGRKRIDQFKISFPYFGELFQKIYLSRIADNLDTLLSAGIPIIRSLEITGKVVDNNIFKDIMSDTVDTVKSGKAVSDAFAQHPEIPAIMVQMVRVGEETGSIGKILKTLARFYRREVETSVDTLIGLIEPALIIGLAVAVGFLLVSILLPIYNIAGGI
ncbi:MAG: type II secretion system F family protein [Candidatus Nomurabacteria bacterium]|nr:type II secretion system F family protein [Candidatus Nomurabacteria bacterium]